MKLCNYNDNRIGLVDGEYVHELSPKTDGTHLGIVDICNMKYSDVAALCDGEKRLKLTDVRLNSPIPKPGKIVAAPVNYRAHVKEMLESGQAHGHILTDIRQAGMFLKASSSVIGPAAAIQQRFLDRRTDHEIELCVVFGRYAKNVSAKDALNYVAGYCLGLDITVRGTEDRSFRKSIDTYCVLGPWVTTPDEAPAPHAVDLELKVNGQTRQKANTSDMVMDVPELIEFATSFYSFEPGDVLMTGTPQGVGPIRPGDVLDVRGTGLGQFTTSVIAAG